MILPALKRRLELRARWGRPGDGNSWGASWYFDEIRKRREAAAVVEDKSWSDLELPRFFTAIDTTVTPVGSQVLYAWLRIFEYEKATLDNRHQACAALRSNQAQREDIQLALRPLDVTPSAFIADLLVGPEPERVPRARLLTAWALFTVIVVAAGALQWVPWWLCALPLLINAVVSLIIDAKLSRNVNALMSLGRLLAVARGIGALRRCVSFSYLEQIDAEAPKRKRLMRQIKSLAGIDSARSVFLVGGLIVTANLFFLLKFVLYARSIDRIARTRSEWISTFDLVGAIDASIAIANFMVRYPQHCRPQIEEATLRIENGYHPLIADPVKNSVDLTGRSALVTGSNMTGKTTFIKMIALNVVLGHTLGLCLAEAAILPRSPVRALIRGEQSVESGKSRYFAEAEAIRGFIDEAATGACRIFILDEPFSGTNTVERIAIAKAVLQAISATSQVLVTTHDVELQHLLGDRFALFYFQEDPAVQGYFDHQLHSGTSTQRNAIRVLERLGYPPEIIADALATVPAVERG